MRRTRGRGESVRIDEERVEAIGFGHGTDERGALVVCASPASGTDCTSNHPLERGDLAVKLEYGVSVEPAERDAREALLAGGEAQLNGVGTPVPALPLRGALVLGLLLTLLGAVRMRLLDRTNIARPDDSSLMMATA